MCSASGSTCSRWCRMSLRPAFPLQPGRTCRWCRSRLGAMGLCGGAGLHPERHLAGPPRGHGPTREPPACPALPARLRSGDGGRPDGVGRPLAGRGGAGAAAPAAPLARPGRPLPAGSARGAAPQPGRACSGPLPARLGQPPPLPQGPEPGASGGVLAGGDPERRAGPAELPGGRLGGRAVGTFPFLDPDFLSAPKNELPLFHRVFKPEYHNLFFIGLLQPLGSILPLSEA